MSEKTADKLTVNFDRDPKGLDTPVLAVTRTRSDGIIELVKAYTGMAAENLYYVLAHVE